VDEVQDVVGHGGGADGGEGDPGGVPLGVAPQAPSSHAPDQGGVAPQVTTILRLLSTVDCLCCCNQLRLVVTSVSCRS